jgi:hypothetical protein
MTARDKILRSAAAIALGTSVLVTTHAVLADGAGAFIGGVFATKLLDNMSRRTQAEEAQAAAQPTYVPAAPPKQSAPPKKSAEERIQELDNLAAGGYITPEEYKTKKQQILNSL